MRVCVCVCVCLRDVCTETEKEDLQKMCDKLTLKNGRLQDQLSTYEFENGAKKMSFFEFCFILCVFKPQNKTTDDEQPP